MNNGKRWFVVVTYAAAMAWVESAVVFYLRTMVDRIEPYQPNPLPIATGFAKAELVREAATLIMLLTVGILAGRNWRSRLGYSAIAFGVWDIFYYVFLKVLCGWPHSLLDWDVLFLIPLPWWGPVAAPVSIALLLILWGTLASGWEPLTTNSSPLPSPRISLSPSDGERGLFFRRGSGEKRAWVLNFIGVVLALYVFMADNLRIARQGVDAWRNMRPHWFNWPLFCVALLLMAAPVLQLLWRIHRHNRQRQLDLDYDKWIAHFARNRENRPEPDWNRVFSLQPEAVAPLLRSLEQFQLGDGGGPASLIARDAERFRSVTPQMRKLVDAWFAEEREHSRLLGCAVDRLGGKRIESHWSFTAFCQCRRVLGVRFELQVLLLTEITSTAYYRLLQRHSPIPALAAMCGLILRDEAGHISFHRDRLAAAGRSRRGLIAWLWAAQFCLCGYAAATMLWVNHRPCLTTLGATTPEFYREVRLELGRFLKSLAKRLAFQARASRQSNLREPGASVAPDELIQPL